MTDTATELGVEQKGLFQDGCCTAVHTHAWLCLNTFPGLSKTNQTPGLPNLSKTNQSPGSLLSSFRAEIFSCAIFGAAA